MPRVSVLLSSYNHETFVAEAIQSVLDQDYEDWELIIRDDGSTDGTTEVIARFNDPRIRHLGCGPRVGGAASLNRCLHQATGEFVAIMNSDDVLLPHRLSTQVEILDNQRKMAAAFSFAEVVDQRGNPYHGDDLARGSLFTQPNRTRHEWLRYFFQKGNCLCHPSVLIRRHIFGEIGHYDSLMQRLPDFDLWIRLCSRHEIYIHQSALLRFRLMDDKSNASANSPPNRELLAYEHAKVLANFAAEPIRSQLSEVFPEWVAPGDSQEQCLVGLAKAALAIPSSPHHTFALDCLREHVQRTKNSEASNADDEKLLNLALSAQPFSLLAESSTRWSIVCRSAGEADFPNKSANIVRSLASGTTRSDTVELPTGVVQLRLEFDGAYQTLEVLSMTLVASDGREIWCLEGAAGDDLQITGALPIDSPGNGLELVRTEGNTRLLLPEFAAQDGLRLRCSLRIRHDILDLVREREAISKKLKTAEKRTQQLRKSLASAVEWQKQPWFKRAFLRWQPPEE